MLFERQSNYAAFEHFAPSLLYYVRIVSGSVLNINGSFALIKLSFYILSNGFEFSYIQLILAHLSTAGADGTKQRSWIGPNTIVSGSRPGARDGFGISMVRGIQIFIFGGSASTSNLNDLYRFN